MLLPSAVSNKDKILENMKWKSKPFLPAEARIKPREGQSALFLLSSIFWGGKGG